MDILESLKQLDDMWADAKVSEFEELAEGNYIMSLENSVFKNSQNGIPMCVLTFYIEDDMEFGGKFVGRKFFYTIMLGSANTEWLESTLNRAKGDFKRLGVETLSSLSAIYDEMPLLTGVQYNIKLKKNKKGNLNPSISRV